MYKPCAKCWVAELLEVGPGRVDRSDVGSRGGNVT